MISPVNEFLSWFDSLPPDHRLEIAFFLSNSLPEFEEDPSSISVEGYEAAADRFRTRILEICEDKGRMRHASVVLSVTTVLEALYFQARRNSPLSVEDVEEVLNEMADTTGSERWRDRAQATKFNVTLWNKTDEKWKALVRDQLSVRAIQDWRNNASI